MNDPLAMPSEISPESRAVAQILEEHNKLRLQYLALTLGGIMLLFSIGAFISVRNEAPAWLIGGLGLSVVLYLFMNERAIRKVSDRIMPILAYMAGDFTFEPNGMSTGFLQAPRVLPHGRVAETEDTVKGRIGDVAFESWEAEIDRKSGKRRRTVFDGFIVRVDVEDQRELLVRPARSMLSMLALSNFLAPDNARGEGSEMHVLSRDVEVFCKSGDWLKSDLRKALDQVARSLPPGLRFRAVQQTAGAAVFALDSTRDLYTIGGLFSGKDAMRREIDQALRDLAIAPTVAAIWAEVGKKVRTN